MPATSNVRKRGALHRRRIIERPRLLALLNGSPARVRTLIAPAGYGKTTLAEQWVGQERRRHAWFTARSSSTDVAALALGLARAATAIVPDCDVRLREHLRALPAPAEHVDVLAEVLGGDLDGWPDDAWLVLDDYHELTSTEEAEKFVEELVAVAPIQLLIASRQRPAWITARKILYGEVLELNQTELAMDGHEAAEVLTKRNAASASGLVALADGWPAVIGLASVSSAEIEESGAVPEALYEFFAEEVFSSLRDDVQAGLTTLAIAPVMDRALAKKLLGESCDRICAVALDVGIMVERGAQLEIHPLARAFLETQLRHLGPAPDLEAVERCIAYFRQRHDWDPAFDLAVRWSAPSQLEPLLGEALDELLETARLSTIERWCDHAENIGRDAPTFLLARAEVALRRGRLAEAQAYAEAIARRASRLKFRGFMIAGRAAHLGSVDAEALELFRMAEAAATTRASRREAQWAQILCMSDLEMPEAIPRVEELSAGAGFEDAREAVRSVGHRLACYTRFGHLDLVDADRVAPLVPSVGDPLVESGFLSIYASHLALAARYEDARRIASELLGTARQYRLDFAVSYALAPAGIAEAGLRNWDNAERILRDGVEEARRASDAHGEQNCVAALLRTLAQRGRWKIALELAHEQSLRPAAHVGVSMRFEFVAMQAFVLAGLARIDDALRILESIRGRSMATEPVVLIAAVDAITSVKRHDDDSIKHVNHLAETALASGAVDLLVTTYRAVPELLPILLRSPASPRVNELIGRVGDADLADAVGHRVSRGDNSVSLTTRQREVYELLRQGLTNREIARLLVISEATAKLHVQRVFDKVGVHSRKAIAMRAALERGSQATSAIDESDVEGSS